MKTQENQIFKILQAFKSESVLKAFDLYKKGIDSQFKNIEEELKNDGWYVVAEKPINKEFHFINEKYWIQSDKTKKKNIEEVLRALKENKKKQLKPKKKQDASLKQVSIKCPICSGGMYKQSVCTMCVDGKKGYKIRLICENNPDHEVLL